mgnify:CR=1 FL=1
MSQPPQPQPQQRKKRTIQEIRESKRSGEKMVYMSVPEYTAARWAPGKIGGKLAKLGGSWVEMHAYFWGSKKRLATVALTSVFIWFLHLLQIWILPAARGIAPRPYNHP